jgi:hypothetical protein
MATGEAGGEMPADEKTGAEALRSWAYEEGFGAAWRARDGFLGGVGGLVWVGVVVCDVCMSSSASRASSFSRGERGPS